ncbi:MAG: dicarboxylate/amino acid:cation symporter [Alphaproteobacteria bacterium]|nr:dicarboxylate/amino acid:cation symporter [Alphaproteobacteria bacterium]
MTMAHSGIGDFKQYAGYYESVVLGMAGISATLMGTVLGYGYGWKGIKEVMGVKAKAFSVSSSSATMPYTKKALERLGISEGIRNAVVPLGATFNMVGTASYLGMTALCASLMLGHDPSLFQQMAIMASAISVAFAAPGIPASSIAFMAPVLQAVGLNPQEQAAVFAMILVADRVFDMTQTSLNVAGDMVIAMDVEAGTKGKGIGAAVKRLAAFVRPGNTDKGDTGPTPG